MIKNIINFKTFLIKKCVVLFFKQRVGSNKKRSRLKRPLKTLNMKPILERVGGSDQNNKKIKKIPIFLQTWSFYTKNAGQKKEER
jgi:hypothetical protein